MPKYAIFVFLMLSGGKIDNTLENNKFLVKFIRQEGLVSHRDCFVDYRLGREAIEPEIFNRAIDTARHFYKLNKELPDYPICLPPYLKDVDYGFYWKYDTYLETEITYCVLVGNWEREQYLTEVRKEAKILKELHECAESVLSNGDYVRIKNIQGAFGTQLTRKIHIKHIIDTIGEENYYKGWFPPIVPIWRFKEIDK